MSDTVDTVDATGYLIIEGERYRWGGGDRPVIDAKVAGVRQGKPASMTKDQVAVKVTIRLPKAAFEALQPEALVIVPEELVQHPAEVEATE